MKDKKITNIGFSLNRISTEQFAIIEEELHGGKEIRLNSNIRFGCDDNLRMIACFTEFTFEIGKSPFIKIETGCHFKIFDKYWDLMFDLETKTLKVPKGFLTHMAFLTVGTSRGILHSKTEGTDLNKFVLPTINVAEMIKEDAEFKFGV